MKQWSATADDGDYYLSLDEDNAAQIYCHNMGNTPLEYLRLLAGPSVNYASMYQGQCPEQGGMVTTAGVSKFMMVRLSIKVFVLFLVLLYLNLKTFMYLNVA